MKKSIAVVLSVICILTVFYLAGAGLYKRENEILGQWNKSETVEKSIFEATVLEIGDNYFLAEPMEGSWERNSADRIEVYIKNIDSDSEPQVGDVIEIIYNGEIMETYPAGLGEVYEIKVVKEEK